VLTLECLSSPLAASESVDNAVTAVATPRRSEYQPCQATPAFLSVGITIRLPRLCKSSGLPDGPRRIGPEHGFPSAARSSARMLVKGSMTGTGFAELAVFGEVL
jgi:hypothetical protein